MPPKVKSDDNDFHASARTVRSSESERRMYALYEEPPHIPIKIPFIQPETIDGYAFSVLILFLFFTESKKYLFQFQHYGNWNYIKSKI